MPARCAQTSIVNKHELCSAEHNSCSLYSVVALAGEVLLVWAKDLKGRSVVTLPKGLIKRGETGEEAALREVRGETGFRCRIVKELPKSEYFYRRGDKLVRKTVRWFLMEPIEKEGEHDHEVDDVR